jgi:hypothetical protein
MSGLYGYQEAVSQGSSYNARTQNFNDSIVAHNQELTDKYDAKVKQLPGKKSNDQTKEDMDSAFYGVTDGRGVVGTTIGIIKDGQSLDKFAEESGGYGSGLAKFAGDAFTQRKAAITKTIARLGEAPAKSAAQSGLKPQGEDAAGNVADEAGVAEDAGENAAKAGAGEIESSGLGTGILKAGLKSIAGKGLSEASLTAASEIGGKAIGDFGGIVDIGKGIENMANGSSFFAGEDKTTSIGDTMQSVGAVADVIGTVFPPLEVVGSAMAAIGGILDGYDDIKNDIEQKQKDSVKPPKPKLTSVKISPAFSSMGLVASAPLSAKSAIVGS